MAKTPKRLYGPAALTTSAATKYTVPSTTKTIVRHIHCEGAATGGNLTISIGTDGAGTRIFDVYPIAANGVLDHFCYYVLEAAEIVQAFGSTTALVITIDGDELTLG